MTISRSAGTAVCIVGAMRGFSHPNVTRSIRHILQQLSCDSGVDVFLYLKLNETCSAGPSCGAARRSSFSSDELAGAVRALQPVARYLDDRVAADPAPRQPCNRSDSGPVCLTGHEYSCKFAQQFDKIRKCFQMVVAHEERMRFKYNWVVRLRPDVALHGWPQFDFCRGDKFSRVERNGRTFGDRFARMRRSDANVYFHAAAASELCVPLRRIQKRCHATIKHGTHVFPECILSYHIKLHQPYFAWNGGLRIARRSEQTPVEGGMIRSDGSLRSDLHAWW